MRHCFAYKFRQNPFGGRAQTGPTGGAFSAAPVSLARFRSPASKGRQGEVNFCLSHVLNASAVYIPFGQ